MFWKDLLETYFAPVTLLRLAIGHLTFIGREDHPYVVRTGVFASITLGLTGLDRRQAN